MSEADKKNESKHTPMRRCDIFFAATLHKTLEMRYCELLTERLHEDRDVSSNLLGYLLQFSWSDIKVDCNTIGSDGLGDMRSGAANEKRQPTIKTILSSKLRWC
jgi:hypothetical protein